MMGGSGIDQGWRATPANVPALPAFGPDGALYVSAGDGATALRQDYGQVLHSCRDPPQEGGAVQSQDLLSIGDPETLNGTVIRVNPDTGNAIPTESARRRCDRG